VNRSMAVSAGLLACAVAGGCDAAGTKTAGESMPIPPRDGTGFVCDASMLSDLFGKTVTSELGKDAMRRSNSQSLRWIRPGTMVTMDFREDRLNIELDAANLVVRSRCG